MNNQHMSSILPAWASEQPVARLATADGAQPHVVPVVFCELDGAICIPIDGKRKSGRPLKRMTNIERNPRVSLLVDQYSDDWTRLRWLRLDGAARVLPTQASLAATLTAKYPQYQHVDVGARAIHIAIDRVRSWPAPKDFP